MRSWTTDRALLGLVAALPLLLAWDASGLDLALANAVGTAHGFPLRDAWLLAGPLHEGARILAWLLVIACVLAVWWPAGPFERIAFARRAQVGVTAMAAAFAVSALKALSTTSCPWDLAQFGGAAHYMSHWSLGADGGSGRCFPAGHASSGFAFVGGFFAFRGTDSRLALSWLSAAMAAGLLLGLVQQLRGAHFMSHTLWTAWTCCAVAWMIDRTPLLKEARA